MRVANPALPGPRTVVHWIKGPKSRNKAFIPQWRREGQEFDPAWLNHPFPA